MAIKLKQYLENSWYRWASQDRQTWYAAQFQYWENVNIRDMKNGVCLSGWATDVKTYSDEFSYFTFWNFWQKTLYIVTEEWEVYTESWTRIDDWDINKSFQRPPIWIQFWDDLYVVGTEWFFKLWASVTDVTPQPVDPDDPIFTWWVFCALNYANTFLLVWDFNKVWRISKDWTIKVIREFDSSCTVFWLTQEWNYLKIYVSDWTSTKIHYAKGTFDVEYTWLIQTVWFNWLYLENYSVTSDQWTDYAVFQFASGELKLAKISWYSKTDIKWTQTWDWQKTFTWQHPKVMASDWVLFVATDEWIWTFTEYNWWLWWWCLEFKETRQISSMFRYWEKLYVCLKDWDSYKMRYYDLSFHPATYQSNGFIIGRVFDWGCAWLFKKNDQATITYNMPVGTSMELSYRYDRSSFGYNKSNFYSIKKLADTNNCYDIVVPTTPQVDKQDTLLRKENENYLITLENWNWILLEDMMVCPFNKTWNLLEYRFDLSTTDVSKTPTLYEHSLTYYDYMRKYR